MLFGQYGRSIGNRATLEHLVDRKHGGGNNLENLRLAHGNCNSFVQDKFFCQKVQWRARFKRRTRHLGSGKARFLADQRKRELEGHDDRSDRP